MIYIKGNRFKEIFNETCANLQGLLFCNAELFCKCREYRLRAPESAFEKFNCF